MVQILQSHPQEKNKFSSMLGLTLGQSLGQGASEGYQEVRNQSKLSKQMAQENEQIKRNFGLDLTGVVDPKQRQMVVQTALQGANQQQLEQLKNKGRMNVEEYKQGQKNLRAQESQQSVANALNRSQNPNINFSQKLIGQLGQEGGLDNQSMQDQKEIQQLMDSGFDFTKVRDEDIAKIPDVQTANLIRGLKDTTLRQKSEDRKYEFEKNKLRRKEETEISKPILLEMNQSRKNIPLQEQAITDIKNAAPSVGARDYFADITGWEPFRTAEGTKLKTAIKDFFLSDLTRAGSRPNQWIEQQLADALPKIGRSKEANLITAAGMEFKVDLAKKRIELIDEFAEQDREKFGYVKADIDARASKKMSKYVVDRQKELESSIKKIKTEAKGKKEFVKMKSPDGSIYEIMSDDIDAAKEHGYDFTEA